MHGMHNSDVSVYHLEGLDRERGNGIVEQPGGRGLRSGIAADLRRKDHGEGDDDDADPDGDHARRMPHTGTSSGVGTRSSAGAGAPRDTGSGWR